MALPAQTPTVATAHVIHAPVGYGHHNHIPRFKCQACGKVFTSRVGTPLYYLKTTPERVKMVLWFVAEGVDMSVMIRFTGHADATIARWLNRMGDHAQGWHNRLFRNLVFAVLQLDELYTRVRGIASARWLWLAIDPVSKVIPSLHIGGRTKHDALARIEAPLPTTYTRHDARVDRPHLVGARSVALSRATGQLALP